MIVLGTVMHTGLVTLQSQVTFLWTVVNQFYGVANNRSVQHFTLQKPSTIYWESLVGKVWRIVHVLPNYNHPNQYLQLITYLADLLIHQCSFTKYKESIHQTFSLVKLSRCTVYCISWSCSRVLAVLMIRNLDCQDKNPD